MYWTKVIALWGVRIGGYINRRESQRGVLTWGRQRVRGRKE